MLKASLTACKTWKLQLVSARERAQEAKKGWGWHLPRAEAARKAGWHGAGVSSEQEALRCFSRDGEHLWLANPSDCTNLQFRELVIQHRCAHLNLGWGMATVLAAITQPQAMAAHHPPLPQVKSRNFEIHRKSQPPAASPGAVWPRLLPVPSITKTVQHARTNHTPLFPQQEVQKFRFTPPRHSPAPVTTQWHRRTDFGSVTLRVGKPQLAEPSNIPRDGQSCWVKATRAGPSCWGSDHDAYVVPSVTKARPAPPHSDTFVELSS